MGKVFLDYETRSCVPIENKGLSNYASDPSTEIILAAYALEDHAPKLWQPHLNPELPSDLADYLADPFCEIHSFNVAFELSITEHVLGIHKPISEWRDPSVMCKYVSLPGNLEDAGLALGLTEDQAKIKDGKRLIRKFCVPESVGGQDTLWGISKPCFRNSYTDKHDWELFASYCKQDVVAERAIENKLRKMPVPDFEWQIWELDFAINSRGIPVSLDLVRGAREIAHTERTRLLQKLKELTGLENPNSNEQMLGFLCDSCGYPFGSLGKAFVTRALVGSGLSSLGREVLEIRKMSSKSSINKYEVIADNVSPDGRLRHQFVFYGAMKTGRWSGKDAQLQNLARPTKEVEDKMDIAVNLVRLMDYEGIVREFSQPLDVVSSVVRAAFEAPDGLHFTVADLAGIETRVIGWVSRCKAILDIFRQGRDPYKSFGAKMFNKPYEEVTKEERQKAKAPVLAGGFGQGGGKEEVNEDGDLVRSGLWGYATAMGIELTQEEAALSVKVYRETYPEVVKFWKDLQDAAIAAIRNPGEEFEVGLLSFSCLGKKVLRMRLPSGRHLHYIKPHVTMTETEGKYGTYKRAQIYYEGKDQKTHNWGTSILIGSKICENAVQAIARDILVHGMKQATKVGFDIVLHVHDEIGALVKDGSHLTLALLCQCMTTGLEWAPDLPLEASGNESKYYKK